MVLYVYMDESGDLGFNFLGGSSKNFIITLVVVKDDKILSRCMKKARDKVLKRKLHEIPELKASKSSDLVISRVINEFTKVPAQVHYIVVDKQKVLEYLRSKKKKLYNYISGIIIQEARIASFEEIRLIVDKRETKIIVRDDFNRYIKDKLGSSGVKLTISHFSSASDSCLQTIDHISWSIFRKYEHSDSTFYDIFKHKITTSKKLWE